MFTAYFTDNRDALWFSIVTGAELGNDGESFVRGQFDDLDAFAAGANRVVTEYTITVVPDECGQWATHCDRLGIPYTGPVLETLTGQGVTYPAS